MRGQSLDQSEAPNLGGSPVDVKRGALSAWTADGGPALNDSWVAEASLDWQRLIPEKLLHCLWYDPRWRPTRFRTLDGLPCYRVLPRTVERASRPRLPASLHQPRERRAAPRRRGNPPLRLWLDGSPAPPRPALQQRHPARVSVERSQGSGGCAGGRATHPPGGHGKLPAAAAAGVPHGRRAGRLPAPQRAVPGTLLRGTAKPAAGSGRRLPGPRRQRPAAAAHVAMGAPPFRGRCGSRLPTRP